MLLTVPIADFFQTQNTEIGTALLLDRAKAYRPHVIQLVNSLLIQCATTIYLRINLFLG